MVTPELLSLIGSHDFKSFVLMGIEVCLSLCQLRLAVRVYRLGAENPPSRTYAYCNLPWTCSSVDMTCMWLPMAYRAATRRKCRGRSSECARPVRKSPPARVCCSSCRVRITPHYDVLFVDSRVLLVVDASRPNFKAFSNVIKEEKEATAKTLQTLLPTRHALL